MIDEVMLIFKTLVLSTKQSHEVKKQRGSDFTKLPVFHQLRFYFLFNFRSFHLLLFNHCGAALQQVSDR